MDDILMEGKDPDPGLNGAICYEPKVGKEVKLEIKHVETDSESERPDDKSVTE